MSCAVPVEKIAGNIMAQKDAWRRGVGPGGGEVMPSNSDNETIRLV